ncbi:MAG: potassium-transporting ATPase subunit KdpC [Chloroflexi bacterium]|nr:potassium-transporting ATPase subunit KdpC [Chloroflexota bacterium]
MGRQIRSGLVLLGLFTVITGIVYPLVVTGIAQAFFHRQANGSIITANGESNGSELIGQPFSAPKYFWGRPSATSPFPYNAASSAGSNYGPFNPAFREAVQARVEALTGSDLDNDRAGVPVDLVTSSASGLDPHISIAAARYQAPRVARYRGLSVEQVNLLIDHIAEDRQFGIFGEPRVNVLQLNLALDQLK